MKNDHLWHTCVVYKTVIYRGPGPHEAKDMMMKTRQANLLPHQHSKVRLVDTGVGPLSRGLLFETMYNI